MWQLQGVKVQLPGNYEMRVCAGGKWWQVLSPQTRMVKPALRPLRIMSIWLSQDIPQNIQSQRILAVMQATFPKVPSSQYTSLHFWVLMLIWSWEIWLWALLEIWSHKCMYVFYNIRSGTNSFSSFRSCWRGLFKSHRHLKGRTRPPTAVFTSATCCLQGRDWKYFRRRCSAETLYAFSAKSVTQPGGRKGLSQSWWLSLSFLYSVFIVHLQLNFTSHEPAACVPGSLPDADSLVANVAFLLVNPPNYKCCELILLSFSCTGPNETYLLPAAFLPGTINQSMPVQFICKLIWMSLLILNG